MKHIIHTLVFSLAFLTLFSTCKNPEIDYNTFTITAIDVKPASHSVTISGSYDFSGEVVGMTLNIGLDEQLADAESHPMNVEGQSFSATVNNLAAGTQYYYCFVVEFGDKHQLVTEMADFTTLKTPPVVRTLEVVSTDNSTLQVKAIVDDDGGSAITERGVCWNLSGNPYYADTHVTHHENDIGEYSCQINGLEHNTTYYVRAYAKNGLGISYAAEVLRYETNDFKLPTVETKQVSEVTQTTALCGGKIVNEGSSPVSQYGICWSTSPNPNIEGYHTSNNEDVNEFSVNLTDLASGTTYYVCAYAINGEGIGYGEIISFSTLSPNLCNISVSCNPIEGGNAEGGGIFAEGVNHQVKATANTHYDFKNWTENGQSVSTSAEYTFVVNCNRTLVANFIIKQYRIQATSNPSNGGTVDGIGDYDYGQSCTLTATANEGYVFEKWTENGSEIPNSQAVYEFTVEGPRTLVAHFKALPQIPEGCIEALYSVSPTLQVYFSQGNLQYKASTGTWRFAENQWNFVGGTVLSTGQHCGNVNGSSNNNISQTYSGWIDLFGWGTGDDPTKFLIDENYNEFHDWGDNPISNGGNTMGLWRTLTKDEWDYVLFSRQASTIGGTPDARFTKAVVNNVKGIILFPDLYTHPSGVPVQNINKDEADFLNSYEEQDWTQMHENGCVFLPVAGLRKDVNFSSSEEGHYWSSSSNGGSTRLELWFKNNLLKPNFGTSAFLGESVRLVHEHH